MYSFVKKIRSRLLVLLTHNLALPMLKKIRNEEPFPFTENELLAFEQGSLGLDLVNFLRARNVKVIKHYARHDIKHVLLEYDTTDDGEVCLQFFMLGNKHISFPVLATVLYGLLTIPEHWKKFKDAYMRGKSSIEISNFKWFEILHLQTVQIRETINSRR